MLRLTDTRTRRAEPVLPPAGEPLRIYACGPTVYRPAHVGNLRTFLLTDLIRRVAEDRYGWPVLLVQNITDVGHLAEDPHEHPEDAASRPDAGGPPDKVLAEARRLGVGPLELARRFEAAFHRDAAALGLRPAHAYPRASESVDLMIELVARLLDRGHAYLGADGSVFFDAHSAPGYGALSGNRLDALAPGHRVVGVDPAKRFHADWVLWRRAGRRRQLVWDSPWGRGFPGWHVECSAMSLHHLAGRVDVHTGGIDLRFPHHEDERAQSDAAAGHEVVRRWVHAEHLLFDGRKMAKSSGNVVLLDDVVGRGHDPLALRLAFCEHHYRQQLNLTWDTVAAADRTLRRWRARVAEWAQAPGAPPPRGWVEPAYAALDADLDTAAVVRLLRRAERDPGLPAGARFELFAHLDRFLGLELTRDVGRAGSPAPEELPEGAGELLAARSRARGARDYAAADRLRDELAGLGVSVRDTPDGQRWSVRSAPG